MEEKLIQVSPGVYVDPTKVRLPVGSKVVLLNDEGYRTIGLTTSQKDTMVRLFEAGEIVLYRPAPRIMFLDLASWNALLKRSAEDPWYWEDRKRRDRYRGTYS